MNTTNEGTKDMEGLQRVGFVGLGAMGAPMAAALVGAGHAVTGFDFSEKALASLEAAGGSRAATASAACAGAGALVLMVVNAAQARGCCSRTARWRPCPPVRWSCRA